MRRLPAMPIRLLTPPTLGSPRPLAPAPSLHRAPKGRGSKRPTSASEPVTLRLAIGREGIGIELAQSVRTGCLCVAGLCATLPGTRFPIDVSGGVPRFRHRRAFLQRIELEVDARAVERWAAPRLRGLVSTQIPDVWVRARAAGATVCVSGAPNVEDEDLASASPIVAFEVCAMAIEGDLAFVVERARGSNLPATATAMAIACVEALLGPLAYRTGATFLVRDPAGRLARLLFPEAGARVPDCDDVRWTSLAAEGDSWMLHASRGALAAAPTSEALRARQAATLLCEADDAIIGGDVARARSSCIAALARAPRHIEIARRIVEIDARAGGRCEAALATLAEARPAPPGEACLGTMPGEMLLAIGDVARAVASFVQAGEVESAPNLAARAFELGAEAARDGEEALGLLDRAIARSPYSISARWRRACRRLERGRLVEALADVEHIDAMARGGHLKAAIWLHAGKAWQKNGHAAQAGLLFERALRYAPDEARALLGLGMALLSAGHGARAVAVLSRALELADLTGAATARMRLELARALAEHLDDLPNAIAHASVVEADAPEAAEARGLEGRWRARLGDRPGARLSFARLRELAATLGPSIDERRAAMIAALLVEAADVERGASTDVVSAKGHLMVALRLRPHDVELRRTYREIGGIVERSVAHERVDGRDVPIPGDPCPLVERGLPVGIEDEARSAARVEELTRQLQMDPANEQVSEELAALLESLGRGHELLALLSARIEEAVPARRAEAIRLGRDAIARMATKADASGRSEDASFYRDAMGLLVE